MGTCEVPRGNRSLQAEAAVALSNTVQHADLPPRRQVAGGNGKHRAPVDESARVRTPPSQQPSLSAEPRGSVDSQVALWEPRLSAPLRSWDLRNPMAPRAFRGTFRAALFRDRNMLGGAPTACLSTGVATGSQAHLNLASPWSSFSACAPLGSPSRVNPRGHLAAGFTSRA